MICNATRLIKLNSSSQNQGESVTALAANLVGDRSRIRTVILWSYRAVTVNTLQSILHYFPFLVPPFLGLCLLPCFGNLGSSLFVVFGHFGSRIQAAEQELPTPAVIVNRAVTGGADSGTGHRGTSQIWIIAYRGPW